MSRYGQHFSTRETTQTEPIPGKSMVANSAGGYAFAVDNWKRLERFLILGSAEGSYYASEKKLTVENAQCIVDCLAEDADRVVRTIVEISDQGRAPKNDPAIFALAIAVGMAKSKSALEAIPRVCRIGTHLFQFIGCVGGLRGWGRGLRKAIGAWYTGQTADVVAYQLAKYQHRDGWAHRDVMRLAHPAAPTPEHDAAFRWAVSGVEALGARSVTRGKGESAVVTNYPSRIENLPRILQAMEEARTADEDRLVTLIHEANLPRECIPTEKLNSVQVWEALLQKMPLTAMLRNLGKMSAIGLLTPFSEATKLVTARLGDVEYIHKSRLHPMAILLGARTYALGHGLRGSLSWTPAATVNDALDGAFYMAFKNVEPSGKRTMLCLDVSSSMSAQLAGTPISCAEGSTAMALVTARTEPYYQIMAFTQTLLALDVTKSDNLTSAMAKTTRLNFGGTDCSLPMVEALRNKWEVDTFCVYTDSETWAGRIHPCQALQQYREKTGIPAKLIVVGMVSSGFTIADPNDAGMLDCVGFDTTTPAVIADFARN